MFHGVIPILATPFHDDEHVDLESWQRLIEFMLRLEVNGITILGVLGDPTGSPTANVKRSLARPFRPRTVARRLLSAAAIPARRPHRTSHAWRRTLAQTP